MDPLKMRQLALAVVTPGKCRTAVCNVGQHYPDEISGPQNWCTALKYSNRSLQFGAHLDFASPVFRIQGDVSIRPSIYHHLSHTRGCGRVGRG